MKSRRGEIIVPTRRDTGLKPGQAYIPMHWGGTFPCAVAVPTAYCCASQRWRPFIFGRASEEMAWLNPRGIDIEGVSGLTIVCCYTGMSQPGTLQAELPTAGFAK